MSPAMSLTTRMVVAVALVAPALLLAPAACEENNGEYVPGDVPRRMRVTPNPVMAALPPPDDAGYPSGPCCTVDLAVTYELAPGEFVRHAFVQWPGIGDARVEYKGDDFPVNDTLPERSLALSGVVVPPALIVRGARLPFSVVLVTGRGDTSVAATGTVVIQ